MRHFRFVIPCLVAWLAATCAVRQFVCLGWIVPIRISSHSMAPAFYGPHARTNCRHCGISLRFETDDSEPLTCLNCGNRFVPIEARSVPGQRVLIDRRDSFNRFRTIAFQLEDDKTMQAKRVVGFPGEQVAIEGGDLFVNGAIVQKTVREFLDLAICVNNDRYRPGSGRSRWHSEGGSPWCITPDGHAWSSVEPSERSAWLRYYHEPASNIVTAPDRDTQIFDDYQYNRSNSRALHAVNDLALEVDLEWAGDGEIVVQLGVPTGTAELAMTVRDGNVETLRLNTRDKFNASVANSSSSSGQSGTARLLIGYWDQRFFCVLNDGSPFTCNLPRISSANTSAKTVPFAIQARGPTAVALQNLRILRDLYYVTGNDEPRREFPTLDDQHYLVLGDNVPRSLDARHAARMASVPRNCILGKLIPTN